MTPRKPTARERKVAWLVCNENGDGVVALPTRARAENWMGTRDAVVRVEYDWPPPPRPARSNRGTR